MKDTREDNWVWSPQGIVDMHRPERWGYVQFSSAAPGTDKFVADASLAARDRLMEIYHHQKSFQAKNGRWAASLAELGLPAADGVELTATENGFLAALSGGQVRTLQVAGFRSFACQTQPPKPRRDRGGHRAAGRRLEQGRHRGFYGALLKSDELTFSSGGQTTRGWQATKDGYPALSDARANGPAHVFAARNHLRRTPRPWCLSLAAGSANRPSAATSPLVMRRIDGRWLIIHDHTSRSELPANDAGSVVAFEEKHHAATGPPVRCDSPRSRHN
jgi:hypothetical protein